MTKVELPWFDKVLNPNSTPHWRAKATAKALQRYQGMIGARECERPLAALNYHLKVVFHPPTNHHRDLDNCLAAIKSGLDGIAEGWIINDKQFRPITIDFGEKIKGGKITVEVLQG